MKHHSCLLRINGVDACASSEALTEACHALGKANLAEAFIAILGRNVSGRMASYTTALCGCGLGADGGIVNNLIVNGLVRVAEGGVEDGKEAKVRWDHSPRRGCRWVWACRKPCSHGGR